MVYTMIYPTERLFGKIKVPSSKSYTHRAVILASLSEGVSRIYNPLFSRDTLVTVEACKGVGIIAIWTGVPQLGQNLASSDNCLPQLEQYDI